MGNGQFPQITRYILIDAPTTTALAERVNMVLQAEPGSQPWGGVIQTVDDAGGCMLVQPMVMFGRPQAQARVPQHFGAVSVDERGEVHTA